MHHAISAHFGLGDATVIDSLVVQWPSGIEQVLTDVAINQFLTVEEVCCEGLTGNVDNDPDGLIDIGDLTALVAYLYIPPNPEPVCTAEANIDGDGGELVDIGDLTALIAYLYIPPNPLPASCQ
jgi:hypothetical protein